MKRLCDFAYFLQSINGRGAISISLSCRTLVWFSSVSCAVRSFEIALALHRFSLETKTSLKSAVLCTWNSGRLFMSSRSFSVRCMQPETAQVLKSFVEVKNNHLRYVSRLESQVPWSLFRSAWSLWCSICRARDWRYLGRKHGSISIAYSSTCKVTVPAKCCAPSGLSPASSGLCESTVAAGQNGSSFWSL